DLAAGPRHGEPLLERRPGALAELPPHQGDRGEQHRGGRVGDVAAELGRDVDLHHVPRLQAPRAGDAVDDLLVDADQVETGEVVGELGGRAGPVPAQEVGADLVEL